jgi:phosphate transport system substrate-binding protein
VKSWAELAGADIRVRVVRREEADSTLQVLRSTMPGWSELEITPRSKLAVTTQDAIQTVRDVEGAIGFGPYSKSLENDVNVLKIDGQAPTDDAYPSSVTLALIYKTDRLDDEIKSFVEFSQSAAAAEVIANYGGVPIKN